MLPLRVIVNSYKKCSLFMKYWKIYLRQIGMRLFQTLIYIWYLLSMLPLKPLRRILVNTYFPIRLPLRLLSSTRVLSCLSSSALQAAYMRLRFQENAGHVMRSISSSEHISCAVRVGIVIYEQKELHHRKDKCNPWK